ncbi:hypothetical protein ABX013_04000 [Snodgrassella alvi]|uniref:hypothetical protein n=1 Tax=Snodgrassella alvi TaxID=1196083 RepID=UPI00352C782C
MNDQAQNLKVMQEWRSESKKFTSNKLFAHINYFVYFIYFCAYLIPFVFGQYFWFWSTILLFVVIPAVIKFKKTNELIKKVLFTPDAIYVENEKIDISYLESIAFVQHIIKANVLISSENYPDNIKAFEFVMTFNKNSNIKEDIHFYIQFSDRIVENIADYDYQNNFINILKSFAKEKRDSLKCVSTAI